MRKTTRKCWVRKLDKLCGDIVKARDGHCVNCGTTQNLSPGHLFSRIAYSTRWDLDNIFCQCIPCNFRHESNPFPLMEYARIKLGEQGVEDLHYKYVTPHKFKTFELEELYNSLEKIKETK
jgi:hypothetical protein